MSGDQIRWCKWCKYSIFWYLKLKLAWHVTFVRFIRLKSACCRKHTLQFFFLKFKCNDFHMKGRNLCADLNNNFKESLSNRMCHKSANNHPDYYVCSKQIEWLWNSSLIDCFYVTTIISTMTWIKEREKKWRWTNIQHVVERMCALCKQFRHSLCVISHFKLAAMYYIGDITITHTHRSPM